MAWIDLAVRSNLFLHSARALALSYGTIGASHYAQTRPNSRLERVIQQTMTTCLASLTLEGLPLAAFEGTLISVALPWAPAAFATAALGTAYFAPDKAHLPLHAIEITTLALAAFAVVTAPSAVTLGTLGALSAVWIQMHKVPYLSATIEKAMVVAGGAISLVGLLWAVKQSVLSFTIQYALYAFAVGSLSLYAALQKAKKAEKKSEAQETDALTHSEAQALEELYKESLPAAFQATFMSEVLAPYQKRASGAMANALELMQVILFKWQRNCKDEAKKDLLISKLGNIEEMPDTPTFGSLKEEWVYGTYAHSAGDPKDLMGFLYSVFGPVASQGAFVEHFLTKVHQKASNSAIAEHLSKGDGLARYNAFVEAKKDELSTNYAELMKKHPRHYFERFKANQTDTKNKGDLENAYNELINGDPEAFLKEFSTLQFLKEQPHLGHLVAFGQGLTLFREA